MEYLIASLLGAGSETLARLLHAAGAGDPRPDLCPDPGSPLVSALQQGKGVDEHLHTLRSPAAAGGVFGSILYAGWCPQLAASMHRPAHDWPAAIRQLFPYARYVFLYRKDVLYQAALCCISRNASSENPICAPREVHFELLNILTQEEMWLSFFSLYDVQHMPLSSEELEANPGGAAVEVLEFLGLESRAGFAAAAGTALDNLPGDPPAGRIEQCMTDYLRSGLFDLLRARLERLYAKNLIA